MQVIELTHCTHSLLSQLQGLIPQLSSTAKLVTAQALHEILENKHTYLFLLLKEEACIGMLTLCIYPCLTGKKAWVEDVVVDSLHRGKGGASLLMQHAINVARTVGVKSLMLTSHPSRVAAHKLYHSLGFALRDTSVFRLEL